MEWPNYVHPLDNVTDTSTESYVGFSDVSISQTELASAADFAGIKSSYLLDKLPKEDFKLSRGFTIGFWFRARNQDKSQNIFNFDESVNIIIKNDNKLQLKACSDDGADCINVEHYAEIKKMQWHFCGVTFDAKDGKVTVILDETYGTSKEKSNYEVKLIDGFGKSANDESKVEYDISFGAHDGLKSIVGEISCLQMFDTALTVSQVSCYNPSSKAIG